MTAINLSNSTTIRTRTELERGAITGASIERESHLVQGPDGAFYLIEEANDQGEPGVLTAYSEEQALEWLNYNPFTTAEYVAAERKRCEANRSLIESLAGKVAA